MSTECPLKSFVTLNYPAWLTQQADACPVRSRLALADGDIATLTAELARKTKALDDIWSHILRTRPTLHDFIRVTVEAALQSRPAGEGEK